MAHSSFLKRNYLQFIAFHHYTGIHFLRIFQNEIEVLRLQLTSKFLEIVQDIGQQRIIFDYSIDFYSRSDTPDEILAQKPLILDPSNPYNNVMSSFPPLAQQRFSDCAKETLRRLEAVGKEIEMAQEFPHLKEIFLPQLADAVIMSQRWLIREQSD